MFPSVGKLLSKRKKREKIRVKPKSSWLLLALPECPDFRREGRNSSAEKRKFRLRDGSLHVVVSNPREKKRQVSSERAKSTPNEPS